MNCYNHPNQVSVAVCQDCQKGLCVDCASKYEMPICTNCNQKRIAQEKSAIKKELFLTFGFGVAFAYFAFFGVPANRSALNGGFSDILLWIAIIYIGASIIAGWRTLNKITPNIFLILPIIGWLIYFMIKIWISIMIGPFVLPFRTYRNFKRLKELRAIPN